MRMAQVFQLPVAKAFLVQAGVNPGLEQDMTMTGMLRRRESAFISSSTWWPSSARAVVWPRD